MGGGSTKTRRDCVGMGTFLFDDDGVADDGGVGSTGLERDSHISGTDRFEGRMKGSTRVEGTS